MGALRVQDDWVRQMAAVKSGDRAAFAEVFRHFAPRVKGFLMKSGANAAQAEDCAQDVLATVWQKAGLYDPAKASVSTWIFTIARNRLIDMARRDRRPEPELLDQEPEPDQADVYETAQENLRLVAALEQLPEKQRQLIRRAYWGELTQSEIAAETGLPLGTIKSRIRLALDRLRLRLAEGSATTTTTPDFPKDKT
ncbi:sigma-70 family RNA polymerase sigma factor [Rhodobacter sp. KR11]|uniref:sigma-70 family RNA polymerase sigma factor n=1 Tax=Rhodobacter sp. KR11 TaxID=2974588 RepID=UPI0039B4B271